YQIFENSLLQINYPDNWQVSRNGDEVMIVAPTNGRVTQSGSSGNGASDQAMAYGVMINLFNPQEGLYDGNQLQSGSGLNGMGSLQNQMDQLIQDLRRSNPNMTRAN